MTSVDFVYNKACSLQLHKASISVFYCAGSPTETISETTSVKIEAQTNVYTAKEEDVDDYEDDDDDADSCLSDNDLIYHDVDDDDDDNDGKF